MNLVTIAGKSIRQRSLASLLTGFSVALGVMLMVGVFVISGIVQETFSQRSVGYDLIVGPQRGSELQLVLSTIYRTEPPAENLPYQYYLDILEHPRVTEAIPIALGDVTEEGGFPIVGTNSRYFELPFAPDREFRIRGTQMNGPFDAIIGSQVARRNTWDIGSEFSLMHGGAESDHVHDEKFRVCAVLAPTGTPNDRSVFINLDGFFMIEGHDKPLDEARKRWGDFYGRESLPAFDEAAAAYQAEMEAEKEAHAGEEPGTEHHHHHETPDILKEITSILIRTRNDESAIFLTSELNAGFQAQAVNPIRPMARLMRDVVGNIEKLIMVLTGLIIFVSGVGIFVSIYNSMSDRRREIAIMRALGANRLTIFLIILCESMLLCLGGGLLGLLLGHGLVFLSADMIENLTGVLVNPFHFEPLELVVFPVLLLLAGAVGVIPGLTAYKTDVAASLYG